MPASILLMYLFPLVQMVFYVLGCIAFIIYIRKSFR